MSFDRNNKIKNTSLAKEDAIPNDKKDLHQWMQGIYITKNNRLLYSMRCTNSVEFHHVRALLSKWMKKTDIKINFDMVLSQSLFLAGWLKFAHPRLLNQDSLFQWLTDRCGHELNHKMYLYPRVMFEYRDDGTKALTEVLVIDGAFDAKQKIMTALLNIKWNGYYSDIAFIPFQVNDEFPKEKQIECIDAHNEYCSTLTSEIITIRRPNTIISTQTDNKQYRFVD